MNKRRIAVTIVLLVIALAGAGWWLNRPMPVLTVATWAGPYGRAQASALFLPYEDTHRVFVRIAQHDSGIAELRKQVMAKDYEWDVVDLELPDAVAACHAGLLEKVDPHALPPGANGVPAARDFVPGALGPCWVGNVVYSQVIGYLPGRFSPKPKSLADFFDLQRFPGPRALRRTSAKFNLELALLADGVRPNAVYRTLSTPQGVARALRKLEAIRTDVVWWTDTGEPLQWLRDGRVAFTTMLNGDVYDAAVHGRSVGVIWDRQLYEFDVFAIPRGNPSRERAMEFIRFATGTQPLAHVASWVPYGPARQSSLLSVSKNPENGMAMRPFLPTASSNFSTAFAVDDEWWHTHGASVEARWQAWLAKQ